MCARLVFKRKESMPDSALFLNLMLVVLTLTLLGVGTYLVLVLRQAHRLLKKFNNTFETADLQVQKITAVLQQFSSFTAAFQTGVKTVEAIREHLAERKKTTRTK